MSLENWLGHSKERSYTALPLSPLDSTEKLSRTEDPNNELASYGEDGRDSPTPTPSPDGFNGLKLGAARPRPPSASASRVVRAVFFYAFCATVACLSLALQTWWTSTRAASYACPSPFEPLPPSLHPSSRLSTPQLLPTSDHFNVSLVYDLDVCNAFSLSFVPRDPSECFKSLANTQPNVQADLNQRTRSKGPDTIYVQIDGAERRRTEIPSHFDDSTCTYKFDVRLHNAGPIWLNLTYLYNDFEAHKDIFVEPWSRPDLPLLGIPLVSSPLGLSLCALTCAPFIPRRPSSSFDSVPILPLTPYTPPPPPTLPACTSPRFESIPGVFVPVNPIDALYPASFLPRGDADKRTMTAGRSVFVHQDCEWRHEGIRFRGDKQKCRDVRGRHLLIGDSHARGVFDSVSARFGHDGHEEDSLDVWSFKMATGVKTMGQMEMEFWWTMDMSNLPTDCNIYTNYSSVTISYGSHPIFWNCEAVEPYIERLRELLTRYLKLFQTCPRPDPAVFPNFPEKRKLILFTSPYYEPNLGMHDCRTEARLTEWNTAATNLVKEMATNVTRDEMSWEVLDYASYTRGVTADEIRADGIHYAMVPIVDEWIDRAGLCPLMQGF